MSGQTKKAAFCSDLQFCPMCGTILPAPLAGSDRVPCSRCPFKRSVSEYHDVIEEFTIHFNTPKSKVKKKKSFGEGEEETQQIKKESPEELQGPTVDRQCPRCGHDIMTYTTRQTRSADEGQTVFYTCRKCRFQDIEYS